MGDGWESVDHGYVFMVFVHDLHLVVCSKRFQTILKINFFLRIPTLRENHTDKDRLFNPADRE